MRRAFALKILRAWSGYRGSEGWNGGVVADVVAWIDAGMAGPVPWPRSPFFTEWAKEQGWENVDGFVGFRFTVKLNNSALLPITRKDGGLSCGECHLQPGEMCDICGAIEPIAREETLSELKP